MKEFPAVLYITRDESFEDETTFFLAGETAEEHLTVEETTVASYELKEVKNGKLVPAFIMLLLMLLAPRVFAQATPTPPPANAQVAALQEKETNLQTQIQLLYERLHGITEFQEYLSVQQQFQQNHAQLVAAQQDAKTPPPAPKSAPAPSVAPPTAKSATPTAK